MSLVKIEKKRALNNCSQFWREKFIVKKIFEKFITMAPSMYYKQQNNKKKEW